MKTICFKLSTGEELIAQVDSEDDEYLNVLDPVILSQDYNYYGEFGLKFLNFMPYSNDSLFTFKKKYVITYTEPSEKVLQYYTKFLIESDFSGSEYIPDQLN